MSNEDEYLKVKEYCKEEYPDNMPIDRCIDKYLSGLKKCKGMKLKDKDVSYRRKQRELSHICGFDAKNINRYDQELYDRTIQIMIRKLGV